MIKQIFFFSLFIISIGDNLFSQVNPGRAMPPETFEYGHCLKEVSFFGEAGINDYIELKTDVTENLITAPHFLKSFPNGCGAGQPEVIEAQKPVAYVSGTKARLRAVFITDCNHAYWLRGQVKSAIGNVLFEFPKEQVTPQNGEVVYEDNSGNPIPANVGFQQGTIRYFDDFEIIWELSENGDDNWIEIDRSHNQLYIIREYNTAPQSIAYLPPYHHTVVHTSCKAANGQSTDNEIIDNVYAKFQTKSVERIEDGYVMTYWDVNIPNNGQCWSIWDLLKYGNGQCGAWADFYMVCLIIQGIDASKVQIEPDESVTAQELNDFIETTFPGQGYSLGSLIEHFLVKNWDLPPNNAVPLEPAQGEAPFQFEEDAKYAVGAPGATAQGGFNGGFGNVQIPDPRSIFTIHSINLVNNQYFDPSYGTTEQSSFGVWEDESIDVVNGVLFAITTDNQGVPFDPPQFYFWVKEINTPGTIQLKIN